MGYKKNTDPPKARSASNTPAPKPPEPEFCNMVQLAGTIEGIWLNENSALCLIDPGNTNKKFVPCTLYGAEDEKLADQLGEFHKGDSISVIGYVRPWSQKKDGKWETKVEVRITEIKSGAPSGRNDQVPQGWTNDGKIPY